MAETTQSVPGRKRFSWPKKLGIAAAILVVLLVAVYFFATSATFLKSFVLPRVSTAMNANVQVQDASIHPFSGVTLQNIKVQTIGSEPLLTAAEARVRYKLFSILRGNIEVHEITLRSPVINLITQADGSSNLDPLLKRPAEPKTEEPKSDQPLQLAIQNVKLENGTLRQISHAKDGSVTTTELTGVNVTLDQLKNGQPGKLTLASALKQEHRYPPGATNATDLLEGQVAGAFDFGIDPALKPQFVKGNTRLNFTRATGNFADLANVAGTIEADVTPAEIKTVALRFDRGGQALGRVAVSGPFDMAKVEGKLDVQIQSIDRQILNLAGARFGLDFRQSVFDAASQVTLSKSGKAIGTTGRLTGRQISVQRQDQITPTLDLDVEYQTDVDLTAKNAVVQKLTISGRQNQRDLLRAGLDQPMTLNWGAASGNIPDSNFQLAILGLNLADWRAFTGTNLPLGQVHATMNLASRQNGELLNTDLTAELRNATVHAGTNTLANLQAKLNARAQIVKLNSITVTPFHFELAQNNQLLASGDGTAKVDREKQEMNAQLSIDGALPQLARLAALADLEVNSGTLKWQTTVSGAQKRQSAQGTVLVQNLTAHYGDYQFANFESTASYQVDVANDIAKIQRAALSFRDATQPAGSVELTGQYGLTNRTGQFHFKLADLNQALLRPVLAQSLGSKKLVSMSLSGEGNANYAAEGSSDLKAKISMANFLVEDPASQTAAVPLGADLQFDGSFSKELVDLRKALLTVRPANATGGSVDLSGKWNQPAKSGQFAFQIVDLNEHLLRPFLESALAPRKLASVAMNGSGTVTYDAKAESAVRASVAVTNLVVLDPNQTRPATPLGMHVQLEGGMKDELLDLRQCLVSLAPTSRAKNQLLVQGKLPFAKTNPPPGTLTIKADSLDVTPYYDLFAAQPGVTNQTASTRGATAGAQAPTTAGTMTNAPPAEPEAAQLPIQNLTANLNVGQFFLRDIAISNLVATTTIRSNEVNVKPLQLALNGAPVSGTAYVNLGVKGYAYDVALKADRVPLEPLAGSFVQLAEGRVRGDVILDSRIQGKGITGASLQKNLNGNVDLIYTNANFQLIRDDAKILFLNLKPVITVIAYALGVEEILQSPVNAIDSRIKLGGGVVDVQQAKVLSDAFLANVHGTIQLAEVLTNSPLNLPVDIALRRSLAEKAGLMPQGTPPDAAYVQLPQFARVAGTLGNHKTETDKLVLASLTAKGIAGRVGGKTGDVLQGVGNIGGALGGLLKGPRTNAPPAGTNAPPATNQPPKLNPLDLFRLLPQKKD
jgi:uncharacterized protein involved in outer membrane biogenesis